MKANEKLSPEDVRSLRHELELAEHERMRPLASKANCEASLHEFCKQAWPTIQGAEFKSDRHVRMICEHLEAVSNRQILRLLINLPPRHMKSLIVTVFWPAWTWAQWTGINPLSCDGKTPYAIRPDSWRGPGVRFLCISHNLSLASKHGAMCRAVVESKWYRERWGTLVPSRHLELPEKQREPAYVELRPGQNQKIRFDNTRGGFRAASNTHVTGKGGNIAIYDDPHDLTRRESNHNRKEVKFFRDVLPGRLNPGPSALIVVMQRAHAQDVSGEIIAKELDMNLLNVPPPWQPTKWRHLCLPAWYEKDHPHPLLTDCIENGTGEVWRDERNEGDPLWPEMFPGASLRERYSHLGEDALAAQLQQRPIGR